MKKEIFKNFALLSLSSAKLLILIIVIIFGIYGLLRYLFTGGI